MAEEAYPELESHRKVHEKLIDEIFKLNEELAGRSPLLERDMARFLNNGGWTTSCTTTMSFAIS